MILVVDCGLSSVKLTVFSRDGARVEHARESYPTMLRGDRAEQNPLDWWRALGVAAARLGRLCEVEIVVPTGHMHGLVLVDLSGDPLLPCLTLHDRRGGSTLATLDAATFHATTGQLLDPALPLAKLRWLGETNPELLSRAAAVLAPKDYIRLRLSGELATDPLDAAGTGLYDISTGSWSEALLASTALPADALPPIAPCTRVAGSLQPDAAQHLGLRSGIPVLIGAGDDIEILGATAERSGEAVEHFGTTGSVLVAADALRLDPAARLETYPAVTPGRWVVGVSTANAGAVLMWIERSLGVTLERALAAEPPDDPPIVLPHLYAERPSLRAPDHGASILGLSPEHDSVDIARAFLLALAFGVRELIDLVEPFAGQIETITTSGEAGTSDAWLRLRAAAYGKPIRTLEADATALGCLSIALDALAPGGDGVVPAVVARETRIIEPEPGLAQRLNASYDLHRAMRQSAGPTVVPAPGLAATVASAR